MGKARRRQGKQSENILTVRMPPNLLRAVRRAAREDHRTTSDQVRAILDAYFKLNLNVNVVDGLLNPPPREDDDANEDHSASTER